MAENKMSGAITKATGAVAKAQPKTMKDYVQSMSKEIERALPSVISPERFTRMTLTAISNNPQLAECTPKSFLSAVMASAQLGLEPNTALGQAYILPRRNKGTLEAEFQLGYRGLLDLAWRSGELVSIIAEEVREGDVFEFEYGLEPKLRHIPARENRGNPIYYYACFKNKAGGSGFHVMSVEEMREFAKKYSKAYGSSYSPWNTNFSAMARKTILKQVLKFAPLRTELMKELSNDGTIKNSLAEDMSDVPNEMEYVDVEPVAETLADEAPVEGVVEEVKE